MEKSNASVSHHWKYVWELFKSTSITASKDEERNIAVYELKPEESFGLSSSDSHKLSVIVQDIETCLQGSVTLLRCCHLSKYDDHNDYVHYNYKYIQHES